MQVPSQSLFTADYLNRPPVLYRKLHEYGPIYFDAVHQFWVVTGFDMVTTLLRHPDVTSNREGMSAHRFRSGGKEHVKGAIDALGRSMLLMDPPEHTRLRKMANPLMSRERIESWEPEIKRIFQTLLEPCLAKGEFDLVHDICEQFPTRVIFHLFDVPKRLREKYRDNMSRAMRFFGYNLSDMPSSLVADGVESAKRSREIIKGLLRERIEQAGDDLLSEMAACISRGESNFEEMGCMASLIVTAGHVTTVDLLANGVYQLLSHPDQWAILKERPELVGRCVEEIIRFDSSIPFTFRRAFKDIPVPGGTVREGDYIAMGLAAANHDPEMTESPEVFDITRSRIRHISFAQGPHACLGAGLARLEMKVALTTLIKRMPDLQFAENPAPYMKTETLMFKGFHALPLKC